MANNSLIKIKRSSVPGKAPKGENIVEGELALNTADRILYSRGGDDVFEVGANLSSLSIGGTEVINQAGAWVGSESGLKGDTGAKGDKGETGDKGDTGDKGEIGVKGDTGVKGDKGETGAKGETGDKGVKGEVGNKGDIGFKGDTGEKGDTGAKGETGDKGEVGDKGSTGVKGDKGDTGAKGETGDKGVTGSKGETGDKGDTGVKGDKGDTGAKGETGDKGVTGSKGETGDKGEPGNFGGASFEYEFINTTNANIGPGDGHFKILNSNALNATAFMIDDEDINGTDIQSYLRTVDDSTSTIKGHVRISKIDDSEKFVLYTISSITENVANFTISVSGVSGSLGTGSFTDGERHIITFARTGDQGQKGDTGAKGETGDKGEVGDKGSTGVKGDKGDTGAKGETGDKGEVGAKGDTGVKGDTGAKGDTGNKGDTGAKGEKGDTGDKGEVGAKGDTGDKGAKGDTGEKGDVGSKGETGDKGEVGAKGETGDKGDTGSKGERGISQGYDFNFKSPNVSGGSAPFNNVVQLYKSDPVNGFDSTVTTVDGGINRIRLSVRPVGSTSDIMDEFFDNQPSTGDIGFIKIVKSDDPTEFITAKLKDDSNSDSSSVYRVAEYLSHVGTFSNSDSVKVFLSLYPETPPPAGAKGDKGDTGAKGDKGDNATETDTTLSFDDGVLTYTGEKGSATNISLEPRYIKVIAGGSGVVSGYPYRVSSWDSTNNLPIVQLTDADSSMPCIGISHETASQGDETTLLTYGILSGIDTTAMGSSGLYLYVSSTQGALTKSPPVLLSEELQQVATVLNDAVSGTILVDIGSSQYNRFNLASGEFAYGGGNGEQTANFSTILDFDNRLLNISQSNGKGLGISTSRHIHFNPAVAGTHQNGLPHTKRTVITGALQSSTSSITTNTSDSNPLNSLIFGYENENSGENNTMFGRENVIGKFNNENIFGGYGNETTTNAYGNDRNLVVGKFNKLEGGVGDSIIAGYASRIVRSSWSAVFGQHNVAYECNRVLSHGKYNISHAAHSSVNFGTGSLVSTITGSMTKLYFTQVNGTADPGTYANISITGSVTNHDGVNGVVTIGVNSDGAVSSISITSGGQNFRVGETCTIPANTFGNNSEYSFRVRRIRNTNLHNIYSFSNAEETSLFGSCNSIGAGGRGSVAFGKQNRIGHEDDQNQQQPTTLTNATYYMPYATNNFGSTSAGFDKPVKLAEYNLVSGLNNRIGEASRCLVVGTSNICEASESFIAGYGNEIGTAGGNQQQFLVGSNLLSPQHSGNVNIGPSQVVVGRYNDRSGFDSALRNTPSGGWYLDNSNLFSVGSGTSNSSRKTSFVVVPRQTDISSSRDFCGIAMPELAASASYANNSQAETGGVPVGGLYRDGSVIKIRVS